MADVNQTAARSPLQDKTGPLGGPADAGVTMSEHAHLGKLILRGEPSDKAFTAGAAKALGTALPTTPNTTVAAGSIVIVWTAPNEWLVVTPAGDEAAIEASLSGALSGVHHAITDVSDQSTIVRISGRNARDVFAKGCSLDLHPRAFKSGQSAQTHLSKAVITFWQTDDGPTFDIMVRASFAPYLWAWMADAAGEFGLKIGD